MCSCCATIDFILPKSIYFRLYSSTNRQYKPFEPIMIPFPGISRQCIHWFLCVRLMMLTWFETIIEKTIRLFWSGCQTSLPLFYINRRNSIKLYAYTKYSVAFVQWYNLTKNQIFALVRLIKLRTKRQKTWK